jgi:origin recognition complex subunit 3
MSSSWQDRLPTVLLFEIAISTDLFQEKLPQSTVRQLDGAAFASKSASEVLDMLFCAATMAGPEDSLYLGAAASRLLLDRQTEFVGSAKSFLSSLKVNTVPQSPLKV